MPRLIEPMAINPLALASSVRLALQEDFAFDDLTTSACIPASHRAVAQLRAREALVLAGQAVAAEVFAQLGSPVSPQVEIASHCEDSEHVPAGQAVLTLTGNTRQLLNGERVILNFLQHLSGVATQTARFVAELCEGSITRITDTRKTTPGLRALERYAVRMGGGFSHRHDLGSAVLIKDNHINACGGVTRAIEAARRYATHTCRIECEVDTLAQFEEALAAGVDIALLDNFSDDEVEEAMKLLGPHAARAGHSGGVFVEVSGGVDLARVQTLSALGVHAISVGALTHSAPSVDLGLDFE